MRVPALSESAVERWRAPLAIAGAAFAAFAIGRLAVSRSPALLAATIAGPLLGLWALRRVEVVLLGTAAVIALLPFGVAPLGLAAAPTLLDVATAGVFFVWLARAAAGRSPAVATPVGAALLLFCATLVAAYVLVAAALRPDDTARTFGKLVAAHLLFLPVVNLANSARRVRLVAGGLLAAAALEAAVGLVLYAAPRSLARRALESLAPFGYPTGDGVLRFLPDTDRLRAIGTSIDPNMLGVLLMVAGAIAVPQLLAARPALPKSVVALALVPICGCLLLTFSRGSWLGLGAGVLFVGAVRYRRMGVVLLLAGVLVLALPGAEQFSGHLVSGLRAQDRAAAMRLGELQNAIEIISRHPWFGVGWGDGSHSIELVTTLGVSNIYLTLAERAGLIALAAYATALLVLARTLWPEVRARRADPADDGLLLGLVAALIGTQVAGMVDHHFVRFPHLVSLLWLVAGLAVAAVRLPPDRSAAA